MFWKSKRRRDTASSPSSSHHRPAISVVIDDSRRAILRLHTVQHLSLSAASFYIAHSLLPVLPARRRKSLECLVRRIRPSPRVAPPRAALASRSHSHHSLQLSTAATALLPPPPSIHPRHKRRQPITSSTSSDDNRCSTPPAHHHHNLVIAASLLPLRSTPHFTPSLA